RDNLPTEWHDEAAALITATAPDETGASRSILSCRKGGRLYMGFGSNYQVSGTRPFAADQYLTIVDAGGGNRGNWTPYNQALSTPGGTTWEASRGYTGTVLQAGSLLDSSRVAIDWWAARGWRSWDGRGSTLFGLANGRAGADGTPSLNAWGGGGFSTAGGAAANASGATLASDVEVIGHEFMHNVIDATSRLAYDYESGAINEALADLLGVALTVDTGTDRLADAIVGT